MTSPAARPTSPLRDSRELDDEQERKQRRERQLEAVSALEPQVDGRQDEQRNDEHDREVVRIARERVGAKDVFARDCAVDVDRARPARKRRQDGAVEVVAELGRGELDEPVSRVDGHPADEGAERRPVEALRAPRQIGDAGDQETEVDEKLDEPFRELRERLLGLEVEVAGQVDEQEGAGERGRDDGGARQPPVAVGDARRQVAGHEQGGEDVRQIDGDPGLPVDLLERDREDRGEEEERDEAGGARSHGRLLSSSARSSARAFRDSRSLSSGGSRVPSSEPAR